jgi:hypothetical protein
MTKEMEGYIKLIKEQIATFDAIGKPLEKIVKYICDNPGQFKDYFEQYGLLDIAIDTTLYYRNSFDGKMAESGNIKPVTAIFLSAEPKDLPEFTRFFDAIFLRNNRINNQDKNARYISDYLLSSPEQPYNTNTISQAQSVIEIINKYEEPKFEPKGRSCYLWKDQYGKTLTISPKKDSVSLFDNKNNKYIADIPNIDEIDLSGVDYKLMMRYGYTGYTMEGIRELPRYLAQEVAQKTIPQICQELEEVYKGCPDHEQTLRDLEEIRQNCNKIVVSYENFLQDRPLDESHVHAYTNLGFRENDNDDPPSQFLTDAELNKSEAAAKAR